MEGVGTVETLGADTERPDAAFLDGDDLTRAYRECRRMQRRHDPTFYLATFRLPREIRPSVHALYGFVRTADEIVDGAGNSLAPEQKLLQLDCLAAELAEARRGGRVTSLPALALADAGKRHGLELDQLDAYLASMKRDVVPLRIESWEDLQSYMQGSAGSVGRIMAPLLGAPDQEQASFASLALAFQLTNFLRDLREDYELGRIYLPADELLQAGVSSGQLTAEIASDGVRQVIAVQVQRARELFAEGRSGGESVSPAMRRGILLARSIYERTLDHIEAIQFDAFGQRASLSPFGFASAAAAGLRTQA